MSALRAALSDMNEHTLNEYLTVIDGALVTLTGAEAQRLQSAVPEATIGRNQTYHLADVTQASPPWHLAALNETETSSVPTTYRYPSDNGQDVDVFIIDTGIDVSSYTAAGTQLNGKVRTGRNFVVDQAGAAAWASATNADDCWVEADEPGYPSIHYWGGHGTHVAGIVASNTYGVAKFANVIPLRVFGCPERTPDGEGTGHYVWEATTTTDHILDALAWAVANKRAGVPAVVSMSLGGEYDEILNDAVQTVIDAGISVIAAAGNSATDACDVSPASAPNAITVGAINSDYTFASYSNRDIAGGSTCVSVLAPGTNIRSLAAWNSSGYLSQSGTSMATPVVSGIAALYLAKNPGATPAQIKSAILSHAVDYLNIDAPAGTTSLVANSLWLLDVRVDALTGLTAGATTPTSVALSWTASAAENDSGPTPITDYAIQYKKQSGTTWTSVIKSAPLGSTTTYTVSGLSPGQLYDFHVAAKAGITKGDYSDPVVAATRTGKTSAVTNLRSTTVARTYAWFKWDVPAALNGGVISDYIITVRRSGSTTWTRYYDAVSISRAVQIKYLRPNTFYYVRVYAKTKYGLSPYAVRGVKTLP
jgi:subtilisin family serine protease